jgi:hypothetical protein
MIINGTNVSNWTQAAAVEASVAAGSFGPAKSESRYQTTGQLEAFYVHRLMNTPRANLGSEIAAGQAAVGSRNTFIRAVGRVKLARRKNPAFRGSR